MMRPSGCLVVETRKFVIGLQKDAGSFGKEVRSKLGEFGWEEVTKCHYRKESHALFKKGSGKLSSEKNILEQNETEAAKIIDDSGAIKQDHTEMIIEKNTQLNLEDTKNISASSSKELGNTSSYCPENANLLEREPKIKANEIISGSTEVISMTSQGEDTKVDLMEDMEETLVSEMGRLMISGRENQSDEACSEDKRDNEGLVQKAGSENQDLEN